MPSFQETTSNALALVSTAAFNVVSRQSVSNVFILFSDALVNHKLESANNALSLSQTVAKNTIINESASSTLTLSQADSSTQPKILSTNNTLNLSQICTTNTVIASASNTLNLSVTAEATSRPIYAPLSTNITVPVDEIPDEIILGDEGAFEDYLGTIGVRQSISLNATYNINLITYVSLGQQAAPTTFLTASNYIQFAQAAQEVEYESLLDALQLAQVVTYNVTYTAAHTLSLAQIVDYDAVFVRSLSSDLDIGQALSSYFKVPKDPCPRTYVKNRSTILLTYPFLDPTLTVEVRNPQFDDVRQLEFRRINRKTRGGTLKIFRDNIWPQSERLIYSFDNLVESKKKEILTFLEVSIGKEIGLLDFRSQQWRGVIITPTTQIGHEDRPGNSLTLEFEGVLDTNQFEATINSRALVASGLSEIPPGFQASLSVSGGLTSDVIRD